MRKPPAPMLDDYGSLIDDGVVHAATIGGRVDGSIVMWRKADHFYIDNIAFVPEVQGREMGAAYQNVESGEFALPASDVRKQCSQRRELERCMQHERIGRVAPRLDTVAATARTSFPSGHSAMPRD